MQLLYIDENKYSVTEPDFLIGGVVVDGGRAVELDRQLRQVQSNAFGAALLDKNHELHGKDLFHGKGNFKGRALQERLLLVDNVVTFIADNAVPVRIIRIDVPRHQSRYRLPEPAYRLGLMLLLERACDLLDELDDVGLVFADYEKDEITRSVQDFSLYQSRGSTPMHFGRSLSRLIDTIYFTQSHHSRFLQIADLVIFLAQRYGRTTASPAAWHEKRAFEAWSQIAALPTTQIQDWPP